MSINMHLCWYDYDLEILHLQEAEKANRGEYDEDDGPNEGDDRPVDVNKKYPMMMKRRKLEKMIQAKIPLKKMMMKKF